MNNVILTSFTPSELKQLFIEAFSEITPSANAVPIVVEKDKDIEFDISGLSKYLKCSIQTIHNLKKDGTIPFYRLGRKVYFKKCEIDRVARVDRFLEKILA